MIDVLRLIRIHNLLIAAAGVLAGGWIALARIAAPAPLLWAALSGVGLGAFGNTLNDVMDMQADIRNRRGDRPLATGRVEPRVARACLIGGALVGVVAALPAGWAVSALASGALAVMLVYSPLLKPRAPLGNVAVAVVAGLPLLYGAVAVGQPGAGLVPWVLAAWIHLDREIVKDIEDEAGDRAIGRRTLPIVLGRGRAAAVAAGVALAFIPVSLLLPYRAHYGGAYFLIALLAQLAVLIAASRLVVGRIDRVSLLLKGAMLVGLVALVAGRVA